MRIKEIITIIIIIIIIMIIIIIIIIIIKPDKNVNFNYFDEKYLFDWSFVTQNNTLWHSISQDLIMELFVNHISLFVGYIWVNLTAS